MIGKLCDVCGEHEAVQIACSAYGATSYAFCPKCLRPSCSDSTRIARPKRTLTTATTMPPSSMNKRRLTMNAETFNME